MAITAGVATVVGAGYSAYASDKAGKANQAIADRNAQTSHVLAGDARERGDVEATLLRRDTKRLIGRNVAMFAAQGIDVGDPEGMASLVNADLDALSKEEEVVIRANAEREAWGYEVQALDYTLSGQVARDAGRNQAISTVIGAGGGILSQRFGFTSGESLGRVNTSSSSAGPRIF